MPRMYGKVKHTWFNSCRRGCCHIDVPKSSAKCKEDQQWREDAEQEMSDDQDS